jgi:hypothetical protein
MRVVDFSCRMFLKVVDFRFRLLAFRFMEVSLLLRLQVNATDVSFLVAYLARSFSCGRHAPYIPINLSMETRFTAIFYKDFKKIFWNVLTVNGYAWYMCIILSSTLNT